MTPLLTFFLGIAVGLLVAIATFLSYIWFGHRWCCEDERDGFLDEEW